MATFFVSGKSVKVPNLNVEKNEYVSDIISLLLAREFSFAGA
jgi:hypothetical protein